MININELRKDKKMRIAVGVFAAILLLSIAFYFTYMFLDYGDRSFVLSLASELVFLLIICCGLKVVYRQHIQFSFLCFIFGVPVGILFTQVYLINYLGGTLDSGVGWASLMNEGLVLFCLGGLVSGTGHFLGGTEQIPVKPISTLSFCIVLFSLTGLMCLPTIYLYEFWFLVDLYTLQWCLIVLAFVGAIAFIKKGDFQSNFFRSFVLAFFICAGMATISWYEVYPYAMSSETRYLIGPNFAVAILLLLYLSWSYIAYLLYLLKTNSFNSISGELGVVNWHITEAYLFWFLICYGPATIVDIMGVIPS